MFDITKIHILLFQSIFENWVSLNKLKTLNALRSLYVFIFSNKNLNYHNLYVKYDIYFADSYNFNSNTLRSIMIFFLYIIILNCQLV